MPVKDYLNWRELEFTAESIPHLFHWDLAYLWILSQPPEYRPKAWEERIDCWERLLALLLAGKLELQHCQIPHPLLDYTQRFGVEQITLALWNEQVFGVLSPLVIIRPLPDAAPTQLLTAPLDPREWAGASHCLGLLRNELARARKRATEPCPVVEQLEKILEEVQNRWPQAVEQAVDYREIDLFGALSFPIESTPARIRVRIPCASRQAAVMYVPRCSVCGQPLTHKDDPAMALAVRDPSQVEVSCWAGHQNFLPLEELFIWKRPDSRSEVFVYWTDRSFPRTQPHQLKWPPVPEEIDGQLCFRWNPGFLKGETERIALRLRFPEKAKLKRASVSDALYRTLLIPGKAAKYQGLPIRFEWRDAWEGCESISVDAGRVYYSGVKLRGLPFQFDWPAVSVQEEPALAVGVYPKRMHAGWKPYRVVALDSRRDKAWTVKAEGEIEGQGIPSAKDTEGWPGWVAVEDSSGACGSSWNLQGKDKEEPAQPSSEKGKVSVGIDFGTTASVVYFASDGQEPDTEKNAVRLGDFRKLVEWISSEPDEKQLDHSWFIPSEAFSRDPHLIPSALWTSESTKAAYIRWSDQHPPGSWSSLRGIKWEESLQDRGPQQTKYLQELLWWVLPVILDRLGNRRACPHVQLGFAYPLAFSYSQRSQIGTVFQQLLGWVREKCGFSQNALSCLNESLAAVRVFGQPQPGEEYLLADMGGRTLDITLLRWGPKGDYPYIGSLDFGGEVYLDKIAGESEQEYWRIRKEIFAGNLARLGNNAEWVRRLDNFQTMALEYLRVLIEAHLRNRPQDDAGKPVKVVLLGNGWRLRDLTAGRQDPTWNFQDYFGRMINKMGLANVSLDFPRTSIAEPKHWVAVGALKHAMGGGKNELEQGKHFPDRLPAGKDLEIAGEKVRWHEAVGTGGHVFKDVTQLESQPCNCYLDSGPKAPQFWQNQLGQALPDPPYPDERQLRDWLFRSFEGEGRLLKGPLQLILEMHWKRNLR